MTDESATAAESAASQETPVAQTVTVEPLDLTQVMAAGVEPRVSAPEVSQGQAPEKTEAEKPEAEKVEPKPPWQKTADEIDRHEDARLAKPLALARAQSLGVLAALIARLGPFAGELKQILAGIDLGKLKSLLDAIEQLVATPGVVGSPAWLKAAAVNALKVLRVWSAIRPGDHDHELLDRLDHLLATGGPALDALVSLVEGLLAHQPAATEVSAQHIGDVLQAGHSAAFQAAAINWNTIAAIAQAVFQLFQMLKSLKSPTAAPA